MRIAIAQVRCAAGDLDAARKCIEEQVKRAAEAGAELVFFPATTLGPLELPAQPDREGYLADLWRMLGELMADGLACPAVVPVSLPFGDDSVPEAILVASDGLWPVRLASVVGAMAQKEQGEASAQDQMPMVRVGDLTLGFAFSYEELDEYVAYEYAVDAVVFVSPYGFATDDAASALGASLSDSRYVGDADAMGAWLIGVGGVGAAGLEVFCGSSFVIAPWGEAAGLAPAFEEALLVVDVDPGAEGPLMDAAAVPVFDPAVICWEAVVEGTRAVVSALGAQGAVAVVDGTPSSMLACVAATDALGPTRVRALVLPCGDEGADSDSRALVRNLRLESEELSDVAALAGLDVELARDMAWARARASARKAGAVVVSGADKTSFALGRAAERDLGCVLPFGELYRTDVVTLSRLRNTVSPVIPAAARRRWPVEEVDGITPSGSPESRIELVDYVISSYVEWERPLSDIARDCGNALLAQSVVGLVRGASSGLVARLLAPQLCSKTLDEARCGFGARWRDRVRAKGERREGDGPMADLEGALSKVKDYLGVGEGGRFSEGALDFLEQLGQPGRPGPGGGPAGKGGAFGGGDRGFPWDLPFSDN